MRVDISYHDESSFTVEEVVKFVQSVHGNNAKVEIHADSPAPHDQIYFALQQMVTHRQLTALYDNKYTYAAELQKLRAEVLYKLQEILDSVIIDNESKVA